MRLASIRSRTRSIGLASNRVPSSRSAICAADQRLAAAGLGIGGVEPLQGMRHAGAEFGEVAQFLLRQVDLAEQRIGEDLVQLGKEPVLVGGGEIAQIEVIGLRQPEQDLRRHRALVPLYQVDIARRNAEPLGDLGLRQAELLADPPEAGADEQLFSGIGWPWQASLTYL